MPQSAYVMPSQVRLAPARVASPDARARTCSLASTASSLLLSTMLKPRATCSVAVSALRRRAVLGHGGGTGVFLGLRSGAAMRQFQVTPSSNAVLNTLSHYRSQSTLSGLFSLPTANSIMASLNPPQAAPKWTHTPEEVLKLTKEAIAEERARLDKIAALKPEECTFESVCPLSLCALNERIVGDILMWRVCC